MTSSDNVIDAELRAEDDYEGDIFTCQGCGAYSGHSGVHVRNGEECGEFL